MAEGLPLIPSAAPDLSADRRLSHRRRQFPASIRRRQQILRRIFVSWTSISAAKIRHTPHRRHPIPLMPTTKPCPRSLLFHSGAANKPALPASTVHAISGNSNRTHRAGWICPRGMRILRPSRMSRRFRLRFPFPRPDENPTACLSMSCSPLQGMGYQIHLLQWSAPADCCLTHPHRLLPQAQSRISAAQGMRENSWRSNQQRLSAALTVKEHPLPIRIQTTPPMVTPPNPRGFSSARRNSRRRRTRGRGLPERWTSGWKNPA